MKRLPSPLLLASLLLLLILGLRLAWPIAEAAKALGFYPQPLAEDLPKPLGEDLPDEHGNPLDNPERGPAPKLAEPTAFASKDGKIKGWKVVIPGKKSLATPAVLGDKVFIGGGFGSHEFYAFDAQTGKKI